MRRISNTHLLRAPSFSKIAARMPSFRIASKRCTRGLRATETRPVREDSSFVVSLSEIAPRIVIAPVHLLPRVVIGVYQFSVTSLRAAVCAPFSIAAVSLLRGALRNHLCQQEGKRGIHGAATWVSIASSCSSSESGTGIKAFAARHASAPRNYRVIPSAFRCAIFRIARFCARRFVGNQFVARNRIRQPLQMCDRSKHNASD